MPKTTRLRPRVTYQPKQDEFVATCAEPGADEILISGSIRAGKTQVCCEQIAAWAYSFPNTTHFVGRATYQELEDTTKKVMLSGDGGLPPALPPETIKQIVSPNVAGGNKVILHNNSEILFRSLEDPRTAEAKVKNITLASFFIDQIEELDDEDYESVFYETLTGRLSDPVGPRKGIMAANPAGETHWVYNRFVNEATKLPWTRYVHVTLMDNADVLSRDYVERALRRKETAPDWFDRNILGIWGAFEGKRFKCFRPDQHVVKAFKIPSGWELTEGLDYGWANPSAVVWHVTAPDGHEYVVGEFHEAEWPISRIAAKIKSTRVDLGLSPSAWASRGEYESPAMEFQDYGIWVAKAENERLGGWNRIEEKFIDTVEQCTCPEEIRREGETPRLRLFEGCENLQKQLRSAKRKKGLDDIEKKNDHAIDALRYVISSRPLGPRKEEDEEEEDDWRDRYVRQLKENAEERELHDEAEVFLGG